MSVTPLKSRDEETTEMAAAGLDESVVVPLEAPDYEALKLIHPRTRQVELLQVFLRMRAQLIGRGFGPGRRLLVCGDCAEAGASFIAANLAAAFAMDVNHSALLVHANFDQQTEAHPLFPRDALGLSDLIADDMVGAADVVNNTAIPGLAGVGAGFLTHLPMAFFSGLRAERSFSDLQAQRQQAVMIIDGPPLNGMEADSINDHCDGLLLVARRKHSTRHNLNRQLSRLDTDKLVGIAFNDEVAGFPWQA